MGESLVQVTEGSGKKLHTWSYVVGVNTVEDEVTIPGPYPWPTYTACSGSVSAATAGDHLLCLNAGASLKVRVHRITVKLAGVGATAVRILEVRRTTTAAPTGGTAITPNPFDTADVASGAAARALPAVKATEGVLLLSPEFTTTTALSATTAQVMDSWEWRQAVSGKPIIIPAGTTNGLVVKNVSATTTTAYVVEMEFTETAF